MNQYFRRFLSQIGLVDIGHMIKDQEGVMRTMISYLMNKIKSYLIHGLDIFVLEFLSSQHITTSAWLYECFELLFVTDITTRALFSPDDLFALIEGFLASGGF